MARIQSTMDAHSPNNRLCTSTALSVYDDDFETPFSEASQTPLPTAIPEARQLEASTELTSESHELRLSQDTVTTSACLKTVSTHHLTNSMLLAATAATGETETSSSSATTSCSSHDSVSNSRRSSSTSHECRTLISGHSTAGEIRELQNALRQMRRSECCKPPPPSRAPRARAATFNHANFHSRLPALGAAAMKGLKRLAPPPSSPPPSADSDHCTPFSSPSLSPNLTKTTLPAMHSIQTTTLSLSSSSAMRPAVSGVNVMDRACAGGVHIPLMSPTHSRRSSCTHTGSSFMFPVPPEPNSTERGSDMLEALPPPMMTIPPASVRHGPEPERMPENVFGVPCEQVQTTEELAPSESGGEREEMEQLASPEFVRSRRNCVGEGAPSTLGLAFNWEADDDQLPVRLSRSGWQSPRTQPGTPNLRARSSELSRDHMLTDLTNLGRIFSRNRPSSPATHSTSSPDSVIWVKHPGKREELVSNVSQCHLRGNGTVADSAGSDRLRSTPSSPAPSAWRLPRLRFGSHRKAVIDAGVSAYGACTSVSTSTSSSESPPITSPVEAGSSDHKYEGTILPSSASSRPSYVNRGRPQIRKYPQQAHYPKEITTSFVSQQKLPPLVVDQLEQYSLPTGSPVSLRLASWTVSPISRPRSGGVASTTESVDLAPTQVSACSFDVAEDRSRSGCSSICSDSIPLLHAVHASLLQGDPPATAKESSQHPKTIVRPPSVFEEDNVPSEKRERSPELDHESQYDVNERMMDAEVREWNFVTSLV